MKYGESKFFFLIPEDADDYEPGKGDYVREVTDTKGKYWLSVPVYKDQEISEEHLKYEKGGG